MLPKAIFSEDRLYRYMLTRTWDESKGYVCFVGLNPSTADENVDDPTIRRCIAFAKFWGYGGIIMMNLFAYRATDPKIMKKALYPHGSENNTYLEEIYKNSNLVITCWGTHGSFKSRNCYVKNILRKQRDNGLIKVCHLGFTKDGHPKHPLYLRKDLQPTDWGKML